MHILSISFMMRGVSTCLLSVLNSFWSLLVNEKDNGVNGKVRSLRVNAYLSDFVTFSSNNERKLYHTCVRYLRNWSTLSCLKAMNACWLISFTYSGVKLPYHRLTSVYYLLLDFSLQFVASKFLQAADMAVDDITFPGCALAPIRPCISGEYSCTRGSCVKPNQVLHCFFFNFIYY